MWPFPLALPQFAPLLLPCCSQTSVYPFPPLPSLARPDVTDAELEEASKAMGYGAGGQQGWGRHLHGGVQAGVAEAAAVAAARASLLQQSTSSPFPFPFWPLAPHPCLLSHACLHVLR